MLMGSSLDPRLAPYFSRHSNIAYTYTRVWTLMLHAMICIFCARISMYFIYDIVLIVSYLCRYQNNIR